jgi:hypothetical protein
VPRGEGGGLTGSAPHGRHTPVALVQGLLEIEPLLVARDDNLLTVMRRSAAQPETGLVGVVDEAGVLVGVLPALRIVESVIARVVPESLLGNIGHMADVAEFGQFLEARTAGEAMLEPATIRPESTIAEAFARMHSRHISGLYVVDGGGQPTGYLDLLELALHYVDELEAQAPPTDE